MRYNTAIQTERDDRSISSNFLQKANTFDRLLSKQAQIAVIGLGYVGLPLAVYLASKFQVKGFDINTQKVSSLKNHIDPCEELPKHHFIGKDITFTDESEELENASFYVVAVPTPIDEKRKPNLSPLVSATEMVGMNLRKGDYVVFESTVYPGCTEEVCIPILEDISGLRVNRDFYVGYSPERINPGDHKHTFTSITKIVSGSNDKALNTIAKVYESVVDAGVHRAPSIRVAEAAKVVENTQRDVNIALMNELAYIFDKADISINDVLKAAGTKWNFLNFFPGFVGGHCIGVDPYYLIHKSEELKIEPRLIKMSREVNEEMPNHIGMRIIDKLISQGKRLEDVDILVRGITFKENVKDIRNSKVVSLVKYLERAGVNVVVEDPYAEKEDVAEYYDIALIDNIARTSEFDVVVMAVNHDAYYDSSGFDSLIKYDGFCFDIRGTFSRFVKYREYMKI